MLLNPSVGSFVIPYLKAFRISFRQVLFVLILQLFIEGQNEFPAVFIILMQRKRHGPLQPFAAGGAEVASNPMVCGWMNYFGKYNPSAMKDTLLCIERRLSRTVPFASTGSASGSENF